MESKYNIYPFSLDSRTVRPSSELPRSSEEGQLIREQLAEEKSTQLAEEKSTQLSEEKSTQLAGEKSTQLAEEKSTQLAEEKSTQLAGEKSTQLAGEKSTQLAGEKSTQLAEEKSTQLAEERPEQLAGEVNGYYKISLEVFEGPLDLLLYLIKKEEVDIYDVSLERITNQYLQYLEALEVVNIEVAGDFVVMAANLLYIKSRTLLPKDQQMPEEDVEEEDPRWELIRQLIEYKKFKEASLHLRDQEVLQGMLFPRPGMLAGTELPVEEPLLLNEVSIFDLINAFQKALRRLPKEEASSEIYEETYTVADRMQHLLRMIRPGVTVQFQELFSSVVSRSEMVVTFLAMLELIRMKQLAVRQEKEFGEIVIEYLPTQVEVTNVSLTYE